MRTRFITLLIILLCLGCTKNSEIDAALKEGLASGEWNAARTAGGFANFDSFKNYQYNFEIVEANQVLGIDLVSPDIDVRFTLFDPNGTLIKSGTAGRSVNGQFTLNPGIYRVVVSAERRAIGKFSLKVTGAKEGVVPKQFTTLDSKTQSWGDLGGAGTDKSFKNHFYTFEITDDNTSVDIEMESADTDVSLYLYDALGTLVTSSRGDRYEFILKAAKKGTYTIMAGTNVRGSIGKYNFKVFGKIQNLQKIASNSETKIDKWAAGKAKDVGHTYSIEITSTGNSTLDIELSSSEEDVVFDFQNGSGDNIGGPSTSKRSHFYVSKELPKGTYRIYVKPYGVLFHDAINYKLIVNGQFANFKKI